MYRHRNSQQKNKYKYKKAVYSVHISHSKALRVYVGGVKQYLKLDGERQSKPHLVTKPELVTSIFLNKQLEKKDGSLQTSLVTVINPAHSQGNILEKPCH
jgi:hypothetical protein